MRFMAQLPCEKLCDPPPKPPRSLPWLLPLWPSLPPDSPEPEPEPEFWFAGRDDHHHELPWELDDDAVDDVR
jgi:hypothetical protein